MSFLILLQEQLKSWQPNHHNGHQFVTKLDQLPSNMWPWPLTYFDKTSALHFISVKCMCIPNNINILHPNYDKNSMSPWRKAIGCTICFSEVSWQRTSIKGTNYISKQLMASSFYGMTARVWVNIIEKTHVK